MVKALLLVQFFLISSCATVIKGKISYPEKGPGQFKNAKVNISRIDQIGHSQVVDVDEEGYFQSTGDLDNGTYLIEPLIPGAISTSLKVQLKSSKSVIIKVVRDKSATMSVLRLIKPQIQDRGMGDLSIQPPQM